MSDTLQTKDTPASSKGFKFPTAYTILFALIALVRITPQLPDVFCSQ